MQITLFQPKSQHRIAQVSLLAVATVLMLSSGSVLAQTSKTKSKKRTTTTRSATTHTATNSTTRRNTTRTASAPPRRAITTDVNRVTSGETGRMPRGAYIRRPVHSTGELIEQLQNDPVVMSRFVKVFRQTPDQIIESMRTLKLVKAEHDFVKHVYYVHPDEAVGSRVRRVKRGTLVFVDTAGNPILVQVCANPLTNVLPESPEILKPPTQTTSVQDFIPDEALPKRTAVLPEATMIDMAPMKVSPPTTPTVTSPVAPPLAVTRLTPIPPPGIPFIPGVPGIPLVPLIPLIPLIPLFFPPGGNTPPEVPEPGTVGLALSMASSVILAKRLSLKRRK